MRQIPRDARIYVAGHRGLVGSAIVRRLRAEGFDNLLLTTRAELDLRDQSAVEAWFARHRPEYVIHAAGKVGGILANATHPAEFLYDNLMMHCTVVHASYRTGVRRLLYLGSSCIYPRDADQPITETALLRGPLEPTNEPYAIAKIAGIRLCESYRTQYGCDFITAMPTNLYGPHDNFDVESSHVIPGLMRRFHDAKVAGHDEVVVWGSGTPRREFLHVDDLADCCLFLLGHYDGASHINVGTGSDRTIAELAELLGAVIHPRATVVFDPSKPDGTPRKLLDVSRLTALGWQASIPLEVGVASTYRWFVDNERGAHGAVRRVEALAGPPSVGRPSRRARKDLRS